jgi:hypothetical protein
LEKRIANWAYWLGLGSTFLAFISRSLAIIGLWPASRIAPSGKIPLSYWSFFDGAILMFMIAIASSIIDWTKEQGR